MKRNSESHLPIAKKVYKESHHVLLLDLNYSSNLLSSKIADIPQKLKYETILAPIFEYCFGTSDQDEVWEEFFEEENDSYENGEYFETESDNSIKLKIDWIRDETFLYNQIFNLVKEENVDILGKKFGLWNNRKFILNSFTCFELTHFYPNEEFRNDRELMMEIVKEKGLNLKYASDKLRSDKEIVIEAVKRNGSALQFASEEFKDDKEIVMIALESMDQAYSYVSERLQNDTDVVLKTLSTALKYPNRHRVYSVPQGKLGELFNDRELILKIPMVNGSSALKYASSEFRNDKEFVLKVIKQTPDGFDYASDELKNDREFVKECVKVNGKCLKHASKKFKDDREICELALKSNPNAIRCISDRFRNDIEFISNSIGKRGFFQLPTEFSNDREIVFESTKIRDSNFQFASDELKNDREFVLQVVKHCGMALMYSGRKFCNDREIVMEAVTQNGTVLQNCFVPNEFFDDEEIIIKASQSQTYYNALTKDYFYNKLSDRLMNDREFHKKCGGCFDLFPRKYQIDREIVMECLKTNPDLVLRNAYTLIATDRVLAMRIVKRNGLLLGKLPFKYRNDREIVSFAILQNKEAFKFSSDELSNDSQILKLYKNQ